MELTFFDQYTWSICAAFPKWLGLSNCEQVITSINTSVISDIDQARLKAACLSHSGDWLKALPIASVGLLLLDKEIWLSVVHILGIRACTPYTCRCGKVVDARGLHGPSFRRSTPHHQRHSMLNDIVWRIIKPTKIPTHKEPTGLTLSNGKSPDGATLTLWLWSFFYYPPLGIEVIFFTYLHLAQSFFPCLLFGTDFFLWYSCFPGWELKLRPHQQHRASEFF